MSDDSTLLTQLVTATKDLEATILTAAIVGHAKRHLSVAEILNLRQDMQFALNPSPESGRYREWTKTKEERFKTYL